jgi:hypothetical protein
VSLCFKCNINIFQQGHPCWRVVNFTPVERHPCLFLSYHDGDHYNSVRLKDDFGSGPPKAIKLAKCNVNPGKLAVEEVCTASLPVSMTGLLLRTALS